MSDKKKQKLSASLEDYLEAIYNLSSEQRVARSKDISNALGVSRASVTGALKTLSEKKLVNYKPYGYVTLTSIGNEAARKIVRRHNIIKSFFIDVLGVDAAIAQEAACKAEHAFGPEIVTKLLSFIDFVTQNKNTGENLAQQFSGFCEKKQNDVIKDNGLEFSDDLPITEIL